jgi:hypothetical protein
MPLERTLRYDEKMMEAIDRLELVSINVESTSSLDELANLCLNLLLSHGNFTDELI